MGIDLEHLSEQVAALLTQKERLVVFAESCTAGLVAASLSRIPGISRNLCGSLVVYQDASKNEWLGIDTRTLTRPGSVSQIVANAMAKNVLRRTTQADFSVAVTGHLGPKAPSKLDGVVYVALAYRDGPVSIAAPSCRRYQLRSKSRHLRQREATALVLKTAQCWLEAQ